MARGILEFIFRRGSSTLESPSPWFRDAITVGSTYVGTTVNEQTALGIPAVLSAVKLIAEASASLPLKVFRKRADGGRQEEPAHPLFYLLHDAFNPFLTSFNARAALAANVLLYGNSYWEIERNGAGQIVNLYPIRPDRMVVAFEGEGGNTRRVYLYTTQTGRQVKWTVAPDEPSPILHVANSIGDGYTGYSTLTLAANPLALADAEARFTGRFFKHGASPSGVLKSPNALSEEVALRIKQSWELAHSGSDNAHRVAVLEEGLEFQPISIAPDDAQLIESRHFTVQEVARIFRVPPHLLMESEGSTSWGSGLAEQQQAFLSFTLQPLLVSIEQAMQRDLLSRKSYLTHEIRHVVEGFARADLKARYDAYAIGRDKGWLSVNDIRKLENMNPVKGGDEYATTQKPDPTPQPEPPTDPAQDDGEEDVQENEA